MFNRIISFYITDKNRNSTGCRRAMTHLEKLAESFGRNIGSFEFGCFRIYLVYEGKMEELLKKNEDNSTFFCVGPYLSQKNSGWGYSFEDRKNIRDRFLYISLKDNLISITNDYIGAIPVYYSLRNGISISNIEPLIVMVSESTYDDLSSESIYSFLRYTYLIDCETLYRHISSIEPDSTTIFEPGTQKLKVTYNRTVVPSGDRHTGKERDMVARLADINRKLVHEALSGTDDIILSLSSGYDSRLLLAAASESDEIKSHLRCSTYTPNMSLEVRPARELCEITGVPWLGVLLPRDTFNVKLLEQVLAYFGSSFHVHAKYKLDYLKLLEETFIPGQSVLVEGYMTGTSTGHSTIYDLKLQCFDDSIAEQWGKCGACKYMKNDYLLANSKVLDRDIINSSVEKYRNIYKRTEGDIDQRMMMLDIWSRQRNFYSYQHRIMEWGLPNLEPHAAPEFLNFTMNLPPRLLEHRNVVEMMLSTYYPELMRASTNSILSPGAILKRSFRRPKEGFMHYLPLLIKYFFKQSWLLPEKLLEEMKDPVVPDLRCIGKAGVYPLFNLNDESRAVFGKYFNWDEVDRLFDAAMLGDGFSCKRLMLLQAFAYALKMLEE